MMLRLPDAMGYYLALIILCLFVCCDEGVEEPSVRGPELKCKNPAGKVGESFIIGCLKKTCTHRGKRAYWKKAYTRNTCCNHNQEWFKTGQYITEIAPDNCTMIYFQCVKKKKAAPKIMMDTANTCETGYTVPPTSCKCGVKRNARIVGGTETEVNEYPWMVLLANSNGDFFCGGTLIASQWVLTAGHCMFKGTQPQKADELTVILGEHDVNSLSESQIPRKVVDVFKIITHPGFSPESNNNDIALLKLGEEVDIDTYTPSCIAKASDNFEGKKAWVYGWGLTRSDQLLKVKLPVVSNAVCQAAMDANITAAMLCAGGELDKDSCQGDSGGPLTVSVNGQHTLIGCVSFRKWCGAAGKYGVYGDVAYFRPWIDSTVSHNDGAKYCHGEAPAAPVCPAWSGAEEPTCPAPPKPISVTDPPLLFVGPGYKTGQEKTGNSEIFPMPPVGQEEEATFTLPATDCYIPSYPHTVSGSVAFTLGGTLTICGGRGGDYVPIHSCFSLTNFTWTASTPMLSPRYRAAAVLLPNHNVLVSGGRKDYYGFLNSTEVYNGEVWQPGPSLPYAVAYHCMLYLSGNVVMVGGWNADALIITSDTYSYNLHTGLWTKKASMTIPRYSHACSVMDGEIWVGGTENGYDTEIYDINYDEWRHGPQLPYQTLYPGEFVTHGELFLYVGGWGENRIHRLNKEKDGWIFIRDMAEPRWSFPALVITELVCYGVAYNEDVGAVGGSMQDGLNSLTETSLEVEVSCCVDGELSATTCGIKDDDSLVPCNNICGKTNEISAILDIDDVDSSICDTHYIGIPIFHLSYCVMRVKTLQALDRNRICCLHPYVFRRYLGVKGRCCRDYGWCF